MLWEMNRVQRAKGDNKFHGKSIQVDFSINLILKFEAVLSNLKRLH